VHPDKTLPSEADIRKRLACYGLAEPVVAAGGVAYSGFVPKCPLPTMKVRVQITTAAIPKIQTDCLPALNASSFVIMAISRALSKRL
jgi:hypothetical protein